jgi:hypothetical protein
VQSCMSLFITSHCYQTLTFYSFVLYLTLTYLTLPYLTLPYLTLPYLTLPYLTLPYLTRAPSGGSHTGNRKNWYQCPRGEYESGRRCYDCARGRANPSLKQTSCPYCELGKQQPSSGQQTCSACPAGKRGKATETARYECLNCIKGY